MKVFETDPESNLLREVELGPETFKKLKELCDRQHWRAPRFDNVHGYQEFSEIDYVRDWAKALNQCGHSIPTDRITSNPDDPPDCFAKMDGKPIAVEVTMLVGSRCQHEEWPFDKFHKSIKTIVSKKDKKTKRVCHLHKQFLLISTETEASLDKEKLGEHLKGIELLRPRNFDGVYIIGEYIPSSGGDPGIRREENPDSGKMEYREVGPNQAEGSYPVFEVCLHK